MTDVRCEYWADPPTMEIGPGHEHTLGTAWACLARLLDAIPATLAPEPFELFVRGVLHGPFTATRAAEWLRETSPEVEAFVVPISTHPVMELPEGTTELVLIDFVEGDTLPLDHLTVAPVASPEDGWQLFVAEGAPAVTLELVVDERLAYTHVSSRLSLWHPAGFDGTESVLSRRNYARLRASVDTWLGTPAREIMK